MAHPKSEDLLNMNANDSDKKDSDVGPLYPFYLPHFDNAEKFKPIDPFEFTDPGIYADPSKPNLLGGVVSRNSNEVTQPTKIRRLSPYLGTEFSGRIQISQLSKEGLNELALLAAERGLVVFRGQDFKDIGPERQLDIARHFGGALHCHPTSGNVKGYPEFHVVYKDSQIDRVKEYRGDNRITYTSWHSDISYEKQTPGISFFWILEGPEPGLGGDTIFLSQVEAFKRFSPAFQAMLESLKAVHSSIPQAEFSRKRSGPVRCPPMETEHPLVRIHPVTRQKFLFVNQGYTKRIVGFKQEESECLLNFLYDHLTKGADFQVRVCYEVGTVVVWDNRTTVHTATRDFEGDVRRHAVRITPLAEVPIPASAARGFDN